ncbi:unnamed protein product, partial [Rotaria sp. Silwood1]
FEPVRVSVQGEVIRDLDTNNSQTSRKTEHVDSDEEDQPLQSTMNGRGVMNLYQQRQQKRVKLTTTIATNAD